MSENSAFDPQATEDDAAARSQYMSIKDWRIILIGLAVLSVALYPIYQIGKEKSEKAQCVGNFKAMFTALGLYAKDHDDGLPPAFRANGDGTPSLGETGLIYSWHSDLAPYMNTRASFVCPSAQPDEIITVEDPLDSRKTLKASYGMYLPYSAEKIFNIESPDTTIIIAETSSAGAGDSYDPLPFKNESGEAIPDGVAIGFDNDNFFPNKKSKSVTRLAFRKSSTGVFDGAVGRHNEGVHALTATGELVILKPKEAVLRLNRDGTPLGRWTVPARTLIK